MSNLFIDELHISAFRGLSDPITFDFSSPITVVYATNGTGKTTLCEAAEWLLTGQVDRFVEGQQFDSSALFSKFRPGSAPLVKGKLLQDGVMKFLVRDPEKACFGTTIEALETTTPNDLLQQLAPKGAAPGTHHRTAITRRQHWLRGTRILSSEALAALVDTDPITIERRKQVFADLLGIRHLMDVEDHLRRYRGIIYEHERRLVAQEGPLQEEIAKLTTSQQPPSSPASGINAIASAEQLLDLTPDSDKLDARIQQVAVTLGRESSKHQRRGELLELATREWTEQKSRQDSIKATQHAWGQLEELQAKARGASQTLTDEMRLILNELSQGRERCVALENAKKAIVPHLVKLAEIFGPNWSLESIRSLLTEATWSTKSRAARRSTLQSLLARSDSIQSERARYALLAEQTSVAEKSRPTDSALDALEKAVSESEQAVLMARSRFEVFSQPLQRLRSAAKEFIGHNHEGADCPVCGHDWRNHSNLQQAILSVAEQSPAFIVELERVIGDAETKLRKTTLAHEEAKKFLYEYNRLVSALEETRRSINSFESIAQSLQVDALPANLKAYCTEQLRRLDGVDALSLLELELDARPELVLRAIPEAVSISVAATEFTKAADEIVKGEISKIEQLASRQIEQGDKISKENDKIQSLQKQIIACRDAMHSDLQRNEKLKTTWSELAQTAELSDRSLASLKAQYSLESARYPVAEQHLAAARKAFEFAAMREHFDHQQRTLSELTKKRVDLGQKREAAERAMNAFREHYEKESRDQVKNLSDVVNALFGRMHANQIIDRIDVGSGDTFLQWTGVTDEEDISDQDKEEHLAFDPRKEFSHGQRQDLALSLFIARARSLRGTFFLDEPMTHFDDLNRVGLLDVLRAAALDSHGAVRLIVTTASRQFATHIVEKFQRVPSSKTLNGNVPALRLIELRGNARTGVEAVNQFPIADT